MRGAEEGGGEPLLPFDELEPEHPDVEIDRPVEVGHEQNCVVEPGDPHRLVLVMA
jgi:hypothetical protein